MNEDRRKFIKNVGTLAAGVSIAGIANTITAAPFAPAKSIKRFGLQLYTLKDVLPADPKGVLKKVASFGYKQIESYEDDNLGMFWGMKNTEFKKYLDGLGMTIVSSHCKHKEDFERKVDNAAAIGMKYLLCPFIVDNKDPETFKRVADEFNKCGEICKKGGIRFAYHNHDYSFKKVDNQFLQDVLMKNTDKSLVDFELDMYWVVTAGEDPVKWLKKYPGRFVLGHVKDRKGGKTATLGTGIIDYPAVLKEAEKAGMKYFIVEQEDFDGTPITAVKSDAEYMKRLKFKK